METRKKIIWIDDDINRSFLRPYVVELMDNDFDIIKVNASDDVKNNLENMKGDNSLVAIIIDIAMPTGNIINFRKARGGLRTGIIILKDLLKNENYAKVPKIVFTNVDDEEVKKFCKGNDIPYLKKVEYFPDMLVDEIMNLIDK